MRLFAVCCELKEVWQSAISSKPCRIRTDVGTSERNSSAWQGISELGGHGSSFLAAGICTSTTSVRGSWWARQKSSTDLPSRRISDPWALILNLRHKRPGEDDLDNLHHQSALRSLSIGGASTWHQKKMEKRWIQYLGDIRGRACGLLLKNLVMVLWCCKFLAQMSNAFELRTKHFPLEPLTYQ